MKAFITFAVLLTGICAAETPDAPQPKFFDHKNTALIAFSASALAVDAFTTQELLATRSAGRLYETNPVARPFVKSRASCALYFGASFGAEIGGMYLVHKKGWHRLERILPLVVTAGEAYVGARNAQRMR